MRAADGTAKAARLELDKHAQHVRVAEARLDGAREKSLEAQQLLQEAKAAAAEIWHLRASDRAACQHWASAIRS